MVISLLLIAVSLRLWGALEIRSEAWVIFLLTMAGGAWLAVSVKIFALLGLSLRDDVTERRNNAALAALCGALFGATLIYAGGSVGEGPSYSNNFFSAGLGTATLFLLWTLLEVGWSVSVSIAEERDLASGIRMGGFLLSAGLVLGRAVAGDWHSEEATIRDFVHDGWPAIVLLVIALGIERFARPSRRFPFPNWITRGLLPALFYLAVAIAWVCHLGAWEGMEK